VRSAFYVAVRLIEISMPEDSGILQLNSAPSNSILSLSCGNPVPKLRKNLILSLSLSLSLSLLGRVSCSR